MQVFGPAHVHGAQPISAPHGNSPVSSAPEVASSSAPADELQISDVGAFLDRANDLPDVRADRVAQIRSELAAGTYDIDAKLEVAVDRLLDEIA